MVSPPLLNAPLEPAQIIPNIYKEDATPALLKAAVKLKRGRLHWPLKLVRLHVAPLFTAHGTPNEHGWPLAANQCQYFRCYLSFREVLWQLPDTAGPGNSSAFASGQWSEGLVDLKNPSKQLHMFNENSPISSHSDLSATGRSYMLFKALPVFAHMFLP